MTRRKQILLGTIILGLVVNLLANMVWDYLPDKHVHPQTYVVATVVLVVMCMLLLLFAQEGMTRSSLTKIWHAFLPRRTLTFVPNMRDGYEGDWGGGESRGERAMCIHSKWYVTNVSDGLMQILRAYLVKPRTEATMLCTQHPEEDVFGDYPILPGHLSQVLVNFFVVPPFRREGENFKGKIIFVDQLNKKHKVKARFSSYSDDGELILTIKPNAICIAELDSSQLPKQIRKKLENKNVSLSHNSKISVSNKGTKWVIKDPEKPRLVYTAMAEDKKLYVYKRFIPRPRQRPAPDAWRRE